jgi:prepilin-type N-terminal cleavage/methylation domain-containing protein
MNTRIFFIRPATKRLGVRRGLTLLELVMVVSILAILTALIVPGMGEQQEETRRVAARVTLQGLRDEIANRYMQDMGHTVNPLITGKAALPQPNRTLDASGRISTTQIDGSTAGLVPQLHFLFVNPNQYDGAATTKYVGVPDFDPNVKIGWNGPYVLQKSSVYPNPNNVRFSSDPTNTGTWSSYGFTSLYGQPGDYTINDPWGSPIVTIIYQTTHGGVPLYSAYLVSAGPNRRLDNSSWTFNSDGTLNTGDDLTMKIGKEWR